MKNYTKLLLAALLFLSSLAVKAQNNDTLEIQRKENGNIQFARFKPNANMKMQNGSTFLKDVLQAKSNDELRLTKVNKDELGITHRRYQQYYKGIKVEN